MARGINKTILVGQIGQDPDQKFMPSGSAVVNFSVATNEQWKDKQSGEKQERTEWHRLTAFNKLAEIIGQYAKKGQLVYVEGSLRTRKYQGQDGSDRYTTEIVVSEFQMLGGRNDSGGQNSNNGNSGANQSNQQQQRPANQSNAPQSQPQNADRGFEDFDESTDIPF